MPVRIAYVLGQLAVGGTETQLLHLIRRLNRKRWHPSVVSLSLESPLADQFRQAGCEVTILAREESGKARTFIDLLRTLRAIRPAVVQAFSYAWYYAIPAARVAGVKHVVIAERTIPPWKTRWHAWADRILLTATDQAIVNSARVRNELHAQNGAPNEKVRVIYNGLDLEEFSDAANDEITLPHPVEAQHVICTVASAKEDKRLDLLLKAFVIVRESHPHTYLWIVGDGPLLPSLRESAEEMGIADSVVFWGSRNDVPAILNHADIGVNCSRIESLSNSIIEYMAAGLPVVATDVGGNGELVLREHTGVLVPFGDPHGLADAILHLLRNPAVARGMGIAGRRYVEQHFTVERMVEETEAAYESLFQERAS